MWYNLTHYDSRYAGIDENWDKTRVEKRDEMRNEIRDIRWDEIRDEVRDEMKNEMRDERWFERWDKLGHMM